VIAWLFLIFSSPALPQTAAGCASSFAHFTSGYDKAARIRARMAWFREIGAKDNQAFLALARGSARGGAGGAKLFLDLENAVLKDLNDKVVRDKDFVTALTNLHKDVVWASLNSDDLIRKHLIARYSDFKSLRFAFSDDGPILQERLRQRMLDVNRRYSEYVASIAKEESWTQRARDLAFDSRNWFHGGLGSTPDEAGLAGRSSRYGGGSGAPLRSFEQSQKSLSRAADKVELYRSWADKRFSSVTGFLAPAGEKKILSAEAIETIRKAVPAAGGSQAQAVQVALQKRFGLTLTEQEAKDLGDFLAYADRFSPGLFLEERVVIDLGQAKAGVVSVDFKGQNARNLEETLRSLAESEGQPLAERIRLLRAAEARATAALDEKKARFQRVLQRLQPGLRAEFSGDDGIGFLQKTLSPGKKRLFSRYWKEAGGEGGDIRLTFHDFRYADTGALVPAAERSRLVVAAEDLEKKIRADLMGKVPGDELGRMQIAVSFEARQSGTHKAAVEISPASAAAEALVQKTLTAAGYK
jgi:hypothetical protein